MLPENPDSAQEQCSSKPRIKFSEDIPSLNLQPSHLSFEQTPRSILKKRRYSFTQSQIQQNDRVLQHSYSETKIPRNPRKFIFKIEPPPRFEQQSVQLAIQPQQPANDAEVREEIQNPDASARESQSSYALKDIPVWAILVIGILLFVLLGWLISRMFFVKIKANSKHKEEQIFKKYLRDLTDYQVKNMKMYKPVNIRKNTQLWMAREWSRKKLQQIPAWAMFPFKESTAKHQFLHY